MKKKLLLVIFIICYIVFLYFIIDKNSYRYVNYDDYKPFKDNGKYSSDSLITTNMPKISAAIACYPFASKIVENIYNPDNYKGELKHLSTYEAYKSIIDNEADIAICSDSSRSQKSIIESQSGDIVLVPIAKDGLVFYTNVKNDILSLEIGEINQIYTGQTKNWNKLGNFSFTIYPFQLKEDVGGSEACFASLVDDKNVVRNKEFVSYDMKNIIDNVSNNVGGIGYAFNQFYSKMYNINNLNVIDINGISPTYENIATEEYPLLFNYYFIYRKSNNNPNIEKILEWLKSEDAKKVINDCGLGFVE